MLWSASATATTISNYDTLDDLQQREVISKTLTRLVTVTAERSGNMGVAQCMVDVFMKTDQRTGATTPLGVLSAATVMQQQRDKGASDTVHVEQVIQAVFDHWLEAKCENEHHSPMPGGG